MEYWRTILEGADAAITKAPLQNISEHLAVHNVLDEARNWVSNGCHMQESEAATAATGNEADKTGATLETVETNATEDSTLTAKVVDAHMIPVGKLVEQWLPVTRPREYGAVGLKKVWILNWACAQLVPKVWTFDNANKGDRLEGISLWVDRGDKNCTAHPHIVSKTLEGEFCLNFLGKVGLQQTAVSMKMGEAYGIEVWLDGTEVLSTKAAAYRQLTSGLTTVSHRQTDSHFNSRSLSVQFVESCCRVLHYYHPPCLYKVVPKNS